MTEPESKEQQTRRTFALTAIVVAAVVGLVGLLAFVLQFGVPPFGDGNDPVVVDNPQIDLYRKDQARHPRPQKIDTTRKWTLHPMTMFVRVRVTSWERVGQNEKFHVAEGTLAGGDVDFYSQDKKKLFTVHREEVAGAWGPVAVPHDAAFEDHPNERKKMKTNASNHIAQIKFAGNSFICVGDGVVPTHQECSVWTYRPKKLVVEICSASGCEVQ